MNEITAKQAIVILYEFAKENNIKHLSACVFLDEDNQLKTGWVTDYTNNNNGNYETVTLISKEGLENEAIQDRGGTK